MLFNSFEYLFAFFPLTLALHRLAGGFGERAQQLMRAYVPVLDMPDTRRLAAGQPTQPKHWREWHPIPVWAMATAALAFFGTISITRVSEFLYWQF